jgi:hypothetical protein
MADQDDPETPLEQLNPVPLDEVNEGGPQPPDEWGEDGQGGDSDDPDADEVPQEVTDGD